MTASFLRTLAAISSIKQVGAELHICLYKIADMTNFFRLCIKTQDKDEAVAEAIHRDAKKRDILFSSNLARIRIEKEITVPLSSEKKITVVELYDESDPQKLHRKFRLD